MNKQAIKLSIREISACQKEATVAIEKKDVKSALDSTLNSARKQVNIPGFRVGHAPTALVLKKYSNEIKEQMRQEIMQKTMQLIFEDEKNHPVTQPEIKEFNFTLDNDCTFIMTFEVAPPFSVPEYKNLKVETTDFVLDSKLVDEELNKIRERFKNMEKVDRPTEEGDFVKCNFTGVVDAGVTTTPEAEGVLKGEGRWLPVKNESLLPGALKGLLGKTSGSEATWTATFEENYPIECLRSQKVTYTCKIEEVHGYTLPELNDELAKNLGVESVEELKKILSQHQENSHKSAQDSKNKELVLDQLTNAFECEMPENLLKGEIAKQLHTLKHEKGVAHDCNDAGHDHVHTDNCGHSSEQVAQESELKAEAEKAAKKEIKTKFVLRKIAKLENIEVSEREVQSQIYMLARQMQQDPKVLAENLQKSGAINDFAEHILIDKTLAKIVEMCTPATAKASTNS